MGASEDVDWLRRSLSQIGGDALNRFESGIYGHKDLLAHLIAYSLNLNGPVYSLYTSCSTSLSATHIACRSLLFGECDLALAGGITIDLPQKSGYFCQQGMIHSTDGHCRPLTVRLLAPCLAMARVWLCFGVWKMLWQRAIASMR